MSSVIGKQLVCMVLVLRHAIENRCNHYLKLSNRIQAYVVSAAEKDFC